ncbi:MAG: hypothetical protein A3G33_08865 [Omnitrophica bacterium RIFCSPLOWO2_12_FULL_44_17]|uniref:Exonuclease domain-containing protein n=1 Tax=Candidatus Danuiimicrobium aquiferis TaxID=1801832 RepID=A0A1G1L1C0_9BACT|nr:MAG: hypothetical protein A3B72_08205 [Omnitrophica bacterium RIFCSPHIGHO2_02_FULL_45_28]OGW88179.1 MAG: hypothetical protein A3E74_05845 [Omnitrophica bacterium RIFCSPHIGHO2_12_FULL_44_12]OGW98936.1 MAG: hypothetical protein A3G33_08865 [Omnitrophica bacterium RIFCSPLOWO2_12_FULL_44_17]OGX02029.1 MAG: hypothetical protein A3J12_03630 [Omnitrophica bacterium RIFCSPLOWO2_02_FULL_44_11]
MKITNALVCLDVESTGVWVEKDKIVELAMVKYGVDGKKETFSQRINPGIRIPEVVTKLTGISDEDVKDKPYFKQVAKGILDFIGEADLGGFNLERFDLPLLEREFEEAGMEFEWKCRKIYDAQKVFHLNEKRDLSAAYKFYCDKDLINAHSALADSEAAYEILKEQVRRYGEGTDDISVLNKFEYTLNADYYDAERKFCWWNGKLYMMFGKYARKIPLEDVVKTDRNYLNWILNVDFSDSIKNIIRQAINGQIPQYKSAS